jgi:hypothetical protein
MFIPCPYIEEVYTKPRMENMTQFMLAARLFLARESWRGTTEQIALQRRPDVASDDPLAWIEACGSFHGTPKKSGDYTELNPGAEWVLPLLQTVERHSGGKACRTRIMTLSPGRCLSYHKDDEMWRYHLPLVSNTSARFLVENTVGNMPVCGALYRLRTDKMHTALNPSKDESRTHIVICIA